MRSCQDLRASSGCTRGARWEPGKLQRWGGCQLFLSRNRGFGDPFFDLTGRPVDKTEQVSCRAIGGKDP